MSYLD